MRTVAAAFRDIAERLQEQNRRLAGVEWRGKVKEVDSAKARCRVVLGKDSDGGEVLSPWLPYKQTAGALKLHNPPSVGQVMTVRSETGDVEQGLVEPFHWNDDNAAPSQEADEHVLKFGDVTIELVGGGLSFAVGGVSFSFSGSGFSQTGGEISHDGVVIDKSHVHQGVTSGPELTGPPEGA